MSEKWLTFKEKIKNFLHLFCLIVAGKEHSKEKSIEDENRKNKELSMLNSDNTEDILKGQVNGENNISNGKTESPAIQVNGDLDTPATTKDIYLDEVDNKTRKESTSSRKSAGSRKISTSSRKSLGPIGGEAESSQSKKNSITVASEELPSEIVNFSAASNTEAQPSDAISVDDIKASFSLSSSYESCEGDDSPPSARSMPNLKGDSVEEAIEIDRKQDSVSLGAAPKSEPPKEVKSKRKPFFPPPPSEQPQKRDPIEDSLEARRLAREARREARRRDTTNHDQSPKNDATDESLKRDLAREARREARRLRDVATDEPSSSRDVTRNRGVTNEPVSASDVFRSRRRDVTTDESPSSRDVTRNRDITTDESIRREAIRASRRRDVTEESRETDVADEPISARDVIRQSRRRTLMDKPPSQNVTEEPRKRNIMEEQRKRNVMDEARRRNNKFY